MMREAEGLSIEMPTIEGFELIVEYLSELGYSNRGMNGPEPLGFADVEAWSRVTGIADEWVLKLLVKASREYCHQAHVSTDPKCQSPFTAIQITAELRAQVDDKLRNMF